MLQGDLVKLTRELEAVKKSVETVEKRSEADMFHNKLNEFMTVAEEDVKVMNDNYNAMETAYNDLVKFFTEDPKAMGPDEFFVFFKTFNDSVTDQRKKLDAARVAAEKEAKRAAAKAAGTTAPKKSAAALPAAGAGKVKLPFGAKKAGPGAAVVDEMFSALQSKNALKKTAEPAAETPAPAADAAAATPAASE